MLMHHQSGGKTESVRQEQKDFFAIVCKDTHTEVKNSRVWADGWTDRGGGDKRGNSPPPQAL